MLSTILERLLVPERDRRRADKSGAGFAVPAMGERPLEEDAAPLLVTNMQGAFLESRVSLSGIGRYGFHMCLPEEEEPLLRRLISTLKGNPWTGRGGSVVEAADWIRKQGLVPHHAVLPYTLLTEACGRQVEPEEAEALMSKQGFIAEAYGLLILAAEIPQPLVTASPAMTGYYTRVDDKLGIMITRADRALCIVE